VFPASLLSRATTYVVFPKRNHRQVVEAATLHRKSGEADMPRLPGPAVGPVHSAAGDLRFSFSSQAASLPSRVSVLWGTLNLRLVHQGNFTIRCH
jgi:hypothetical protein